MAENRTLTRVGAALLLVVVAAVVVWTRCRSTGTDPEAPSDVAAPADAGPSSTPTRPRTPRPQTARASVVSVVSATSSGRSPLADVVVTMNRRGARESVRSTSDASGHATFVDLADGPWLAEANCVGHEAATATCAVADGVLTAPVELALRKRGVVRGVVHDATGAVAAKARVVLRATTEATMRLMTDGTEPSPGSRRSEAVTDDYGRYVLTDVSVGRVFVLWVGHPELGIRTLDVPPLQPGEDRTVNVALERVASIRGEIPADLLGEGRGVVELMTRDGRGLASDRRAKIDPENREYVFRPVRSGEKLLAFTVRNGTRFYAGFQEVTVAEGAHVDLGPWRPLDSTLKLRLKPVLDGLESREADLMFDASEGEPRRYVNLMHVRVPIGVDFTVQGMRAGKLQLTAVPFDAEATLPSTRFGYAKDEFEFDGTYAARELVLEPAGGVGPKGIMKFRAAPPPGVQADAVSFRWILWSGRDALERLTRDYKGILAFTSGLRAPGRYRVEVYGGGFVATAEYEQGDGDKDMRIPESAWTPAQTLAGVVRDAGEPAAGALVALLVKNESGELVDVAETKAASDGTFEFRAMPQTSELLVHAVLGGKSSRRTPVSGLRSSRDVVLEVQ